MTNHKKQSLYEFVKEAWSLIEPAPFMGSKHLEDFCEAMENSKRKTRRSPNDMGLKPRIENQSKSILIIDDPNNTPDNFLLSFK